MWTVLLAHGHMCISIPLFGISQYHNFLHRCVVLLVGVYQLSSLKGTPARLAGNHSELPQAAVVVVGWSLPPRNPHSMRSLDTAVVYGCNRLGIKAESHQAMLLVYWVPCMKIEGASSCAKPLHASNIYRL